MSRPAPKHIAIVALLSLVGLSLLMRSQRAVAATSQEDPPQHVETGQAARRHSELAVHPGPAVTRTAASTAQVRAAEVTGLADRVGLQLPLGASDPWDPETAGGAFLGLMVETTPERLDLTHLDLTVSLGPRAGDDGGAGPLADWTLFRRFERLNIAGDVEIIVPVDRPFRIEACTVCGRYAGVRQQPAPKDDPDFEEELEYWTVEDFREGSFPTVDVPLVLTRQDDHAVTLAVLAVEDDRPLAHADVTVVSQPLLELRQSGFLANDEPDDAPRLSADDEGTVQISLATWQPTWAIVRARGRAPALVLLNDCVRPTTGEQTVRLASAARVVGRVHGAVYGLYIYATGRYTDLMRTEDADGWLTVMGAANEGTYSVLAETVANGDFEFDELPGGVDLEFGVASFAALRRVVRTVDGAMQRIDWTLPRPGRIIATVRDNEGAPIEGAALELIPADSLYMHFRSSVDSHTLRTKSDRGGRCEWDPVRQGRWSVAYRASGETAPWTDAWASVDLSEEGATVSVELILARGETIRGRVLDPEGRPIASRISAFLWPYDYRVRSTDGDFELGPLPRGTYWLRAQEEHRDPKDVLLEAYATAEAGAKDVELQLTRGGAIAIELLGPNGVPHTDCFYTWCRIDVPQDRGWGGGGTSSIRLEADPGIYALFAWTDDGRVAFVPNLVLQAGQITEVSVSTVEAQHVTVLGVDPGNSVRVRIQGVEFDAPSSEYQLRLPPGTHTVLRMNPSRGQGQKDEVLRSVAVTVNASGDGEVADLR